MVALSLMLGTLLSEDLACIAAGLLVRDGRIGVAAAIGSCSLGIVAGDLGLWGAGRICRRAADRSRAMTHWLDRHLGDDRRRRLERRASTVILASRFVPGTRLPLYVCAGFIGLPFRTFAWWTSVAVLAWTPALVLAAAGLGHAALDPVAAATGSEWPGRMAATAAALALLSAARWAVLAMSRRRAAVWFARVRRWEFWPMWIFYAPVAAWIAVLALRHRGPGAITAANPGIPDGGTVGESKFEILSRLPGDCIVPSALVPSGAAPDRLRVALAIVRGRGWSMPLVVKPDVGQRGIGVRLARTDHELEIYLAAQTGPVLIQPYHPGPYEAGIFYYRFPADARGRILSITDKQFPVIVGDGRSTIEELIAAHPRYRLQSRTFLTRHEASRHQVLPAGRRFQLAVAGNHAQGTVFRDGMHLCTPALERRIDEIARAFDGFHVGRFDIRYHDVEAFRQGEGLAIVELNGAMAESTDIYDPSRSLWAAYRRLFQQWSIVFAIGAANRAAGTRVTSMRRLVALVREHLSSRVAFEVSD